MKRILIMCCIVLFVGFELKAQTTIKPGAGLNFTNVTGDGADAKGQAGWQVGASFAFGNKFYTEPGIFYQNSSFEYTTVDSGPVTDASYHGIRIPLALGLNILGNSESSFGLRAFGGASSFIVTGTSSEFLDKDEISSPQWGVFAGAGLDIWIVYLDASYQWSATNLQTDVTNIDLGNSRGFFLTAGLRF